MITPEHPLFGRVARYSRQTSAESRRNLARLRHIIRGMHVHLSRAMVPVLHDLEVTGAPTPRIEESDWQDHESAESAFLRSEDNSGMGVWVDTSVAHAKQVAMLADQVQEWAVEELARTGRPTNWPECPDHPHNHPLAASAPGGAATWMCPDSRRRVSEIGHLAQA